MTDEKFVFVSDVKDKKRTARGANAKVRGTGRRVMMPSDYMSEKERKSMNSEVKSFDLRQPMKWAEFCSMPDDLQREYILRLQKLYRAGDVAIGEMMGVSKTSILKRRGRLGIEGVGRGERPLPEWNSFIKYGSPKRETSAVKDLVPDEIREKLAQYEEKHPPAVVRKVDSDMPICDSFTPAEPVEAEQPVVPDTGDIRIRGTVATVGKALALLLGDGKMSFRISWEVMT